MWSFCILAFCSLPSFNSLGMAEAGQKNLVLGLPTDRFRFDLSGPICPFSLWKLMTKNLRQKVEKSTGHWTKSYEWFVGELRLTALIGQRMSSVKVTGLQVNQVTAEPQPDNSMHHASTLPGQFTCRVLNTPRSHGSSQLDWIWNHTSR